MDSRYSKNVYARLFPAVADQGASNNFVSNGDNTLESELTRLRQQYFGGGNDAARPSYATDDGGGDYDPNEIVLDRNTPAENSSPTMTDGALSDKPVLDASLVETKVPKTAEVNVDSLDTDKRPGDPGDDQQPAKQKMGIGGDDALENTPLTPREQAKKRLDEVIGEKVVDRNHGIKSRVWEAIQNAVATMGETIRQDPNADWGTVLGSGAGGVAGGVYDKTANEKRKHIRDLGYAQHDYDVAAKADKSESELSSEASRRRAETYNALTARERVVYDKLSDQHKRVMDMWKEVDEFDPESKDPRTQALLAEAKSLGINLLPKHKGDRFTFTMDPTTGKLIVGNSGTGEFHVGATGLPGKGTSISKGDIPRSFFGLPDDKELDDQATKSIASSFPNRRVRPEVAKTLLDTPDESGAFPYRNEDGTLNEARALREGMLDDKGYENASSDYEPRRAAARSKLRSKYAEREKAVDEFTSALMTHKPTGDNPTPKSTHDLMTVFREILDTKDAKKRKEGLDYFYKSYLPNIQIR